MNKENTKVVDGNFYTHNVTYTERNNLALGLKLINKDYLVDAAVVMASLVTAKDSDLHWDYTQGMGVVRITKDILSDKVKYAQYKVPNGIKVVPLSEVCDSAGYFDYKRAVEHNLPTYNYILTPFDVARGELDIKRHWEEDLNYILHDGQPIKSIEVENLEYGYAPKEVVTIKLASVTIGTILELPTSMEVIQPQDGSVIPWDSKSIYRENKLKSRFNDYANNGFMSNKRGYIADNFALPTPKSKTVRKGRIFEPINYDPRVSGKEAAENINGFARAIQVVKVIENDWFKDYMKVQSKSKKEVIDWIDDGLRHGKSIEHIVDIMKNFLEQSKLANERKMRHDGQMLLGKITNGDSKATSTSGEVSGRDQGSEQGSETSAIKPGYYGKKGSQPIDYIRANNLGFNIGNVIKYVTRAGKKNPEKHIEDLEKAAFYLNEEINILKYPHLHEQRMREHAALEEEYRRKLEDE